MHPLAEQSIQCPWCWELIELGLDLSLAQQSYIEDCAVCCRPIIITVAVDNDSGEAHVQAQREE